MYGVLRIMYYIYIRTQHWGPSFTASSVQVAVPITAFGAVLCHPHGPRRVAHLQFAAVAIVENAHIPIYKVEPQLVNSKLAQVIPIEL